MTNDKNTTYTTIVIEIADYVFANPTKNVSEVVSYFVARCRKNSRTIQRYLKQAREYNLDRQGKIEKVKDDILVKESKLAIKSNILSRNESLSILSEIAHGKQRLVDDEIIIPTDSDRIRAIQQLSKMEGWDAATKTELTGKDGLPLNPEPLVIEIIDSRDKVDVDESTDN